MADPAAPPQLPQTQSPPESQTTLTPKRSRSRFPHPFTKTSPGPQLSPESAQSKHHRDLAVAPDFSYVETTSANTANALAKWYGDQEGAAYAVQSRVQDGRTFYRIRPRDRPPSPAQPEFVSGSRSSSPVFARSSIQPPPPTSPSSLASARDSRPEITLQNATPRVLRTSKSIPLLVRSPPPPEHESARVQLHPPSLRKSDSTPSLSSLAAQAQQQDSVPRAKATSADGQAAGVDILGRLLGWEYPKTSPPSAGMGVGKEQQRKGPFAFVGDRATTGTARMGTLPGISVVSEDEGDSVRDLTDLPEDPVVDELASIPETHASAQGETPAPHLARTKSHPFGTGVRLPHSRTSSSLRPEAPSPLPQPGEELHQMREVASSDSIRTAKADDDPPPSKRATKRFQDPAVFDFLQSLDLSSPSSPPPTQPHHAYTPHHARLPSSTSLASFSSDNPHDIVVSAVPGDDPRFVLWGLKDTDLSVRAPSVPGTPISLGFRRGSITVHDPLDAASPPPSSVSSPATSASSKRWSQRRSHPDGSGGGGGHPSSPASSVRDSISSASDGHAGKVLLGATVERWVAELTTQINPDLLAGFFLTYRSFVRPLDLMRLLATRFDWAMAEPSCPEDEAGRRIVRVRTFVVIRHWLLNHFSDDFVPDRKLRSALTDWLNSESRVERIRESPKDLRLIKGLKKIVRRLKETHTAIALADVEESARQLQLANGRRVGSAESPGGAHREASDEDVDLDLDNAPTRTILLESPSRLLRTGRFDSSLSSKLAAAAATSPSPSHSSQASDTDFSALRSPNLSFPLPNSQNAIARSFTSALGTFGRFKRMLGNRTAVGGAVGQQQQQYFGGAMSSPSSPSGGQFGEFGGLELEESATGDLLYAKEGLASFLEYYNIPLVPDQEDLDASPTPALDHSVGSASLQTSSEEVLTESDGFSFLGSDPVVVPQPTATIGLGFSTAGTAAEPPLAPASAHQTIKSSNLSPATAYDLLDYDPYSAWGPGGSRHQSARIELDDVDLSDEDEDVTEVKRTLKRLPAAANLRLATTLRQLVPPSPSSRDSVASSVMSYGTPQHANSRISYGGADRESVAYVDDSEDLPGGVPVVANFILEGIDDSDDEDTGGIEAALRRLEGIVDDSQEREKARRVARQMEKSDKLAKAKLAPAPSAASSAGASDDDEQPSSDAQSLNLRSRTASSNSAGSIPTSMASFEGGPPVPESPEPSLLLPSSPPPPQLPTSPTSPPRISPSKAQPRSFGRRTLASKPLASKIFGSRPPSSILPPPSAGLSVSASSHAPPTHRSFILHCRTEVLAQQFCLIERDMFRLLSWQELVGGGWRDHGQQHAEVLDWEAYIKERRKRDLEKREVGDRTPEALQALIARYNLTSNWVASEIVLTVNMDERVALIAKFIRLAFKCYCQNNFQTMTQIIHGLGLPDIERLKRTWARVPVWEMRKYRGMATFVSPVKNFKHLREVQTALINEYGPVGQRAPAHRSATGKGAKAPPVPTGCIPFLGIFLKDLASLSELPTFLDPSSTTTPAEVNSVGDLERIADPTAFFSLRALPSGVRLRPLVNVHKFRMVADEVQLVLAFQEFSEKYLWEPEPSLYLRTLKIRCLDANTLRECSTRLTQS